MKVIVRAQFKGGPKSGHHGHAGRPGKRGGSAPKAGAGFSVGELRSDPLIKKYFAGGKTSEASLKWADRISIGRELPGRKKQDLSLYRLKGDDAGKYMARVHSGLRVSLSTRGESSMHDAPGAAIKDAISKASRFLSEV